MVLLTASAGEGAARKQLSGLSRSLVCFAVETYFGTACPETVVMSGGKPDFAPGAGLHFSVSHSGDRVLIGVSEGTLGVDTERRREVKAGYYERLFSPEMRRSFDYFTGWTLRESYFKLTGEGNLMTLDFSESSGRIIAPRSDVFCRVYDDIPGFAVSVSSYENDFPDSIGEISPDRLRGNKITT